MTDFSVSPLPRGGVTNAAAVFFSDDSGPIRKKKSGAEFPDIALSVRKTRCRRHFYSLSVVLVGLAYLSLLALGLGLGGCAAAPGDQNDPFEGTNRDIFAFNQALDKNVARPVAEGYVEVVPDPVRTGIHNVLQNLQKPVVLGNDLLQGEMSRAGETFARLVTNSTLGLGGMIDVATISGVPDHSEDFGQTLAVWGFGEGPYLMLPFLGPSNPRDLVGKGADYFMDPLTYAHYNFENLANDSRIGFGILDLRAGTLEETDQIERTSLDFYATMRSLYRQYRKSEINNGQNPDGDEDQDSELDP